MKDLLQSLYQQLATITALEYISEDWGQLDDYNNAMPVKWPCALIDVQQAHFSNLGRDQQRPAQNLQQAQINVRVKVAHLRLNSNSLQAPRLHQTAAWEIWDLLEKVHQALHGFRPCHNASRMQRLSLSRSMRDDGVQLYFLDFSLEMFGL
jgi:hypothetical protein